MFKELSNYLKHKFVEPFKKDLKVITDGHQDWRKTPNDNLERMKWAEGLAISLLGFLALSAFNPFFLVPIAGAIGLLGYETINQYNKAKHKYETMDKAAKDKVTNKEEATNAYLKAREQWVTKPQPA